MLTSYKQLAKELNLSDVYRDEAQLDALRGWCEQHFIYNRSMSTIATPEHEYQILTNFTKEYFDFFLPQSHELNTSNPNFMDLTPIQWAAYRGYTDFLKEHKGNVDPNTGRTPLHLTASLGNLPIVKVLLAAGAPVCPDLTNTYPTHLALCVTAAEQDPNVLAENISKRIEIYNLIKNQAPASMQQVNQDGNNVAHYMAIYGFESLLDELCAQQSSLLIAKNNSDCSPAHLTILSDKLSCLKRLLTDERVKKLLDAEGGTLLHCAAKYGSKEYVMACIDAGVAYAENHQGITPAMNAILADNADALSVFSSERLEQERIGPQKGTLLHYAIQNGKPFCTAWLMEHTNLATVTDKKGTYPENEQEHGYNSTTTLRM